MTAQKIRIIGVLFSDGAKYVFHKLATFSGDHWWLTNPMESRNQSNFYQELAVNRWVKPFLLR